MIGTKTKLGHAWVETVHGFFFVYLWDSLHLHSEKVSKVVYDIFGSW